MYMYGVRKPYLSLSVVISIIIIISLVICVVVVTKMTSKVGFAESVHLR